MFNLTVFSIIYFAYIYAESNFIRNKLKIFSNDYISNSSIDDKKIKFSSFLPSYKIL